MKKLIMLAGAAALASSAAVAAKADNAKGQGQTNHAALNYTQAMLIQYCLFTAYLVIGAPGAKLVKKIGYMRGGAVAGLVIMP